MLKDSFFSIKESVDFENGRTSRLTLNASHPIFQAHFAGNPIMPGACIVQLVKELASDYFDREFFTCTIKNTKFLQAINPLESPEINAQLTFTQQETGRISVSAVLFIPQETACLSVPAELKKEDKVFTKSVLILENRNGA